MEIILNNNVTVVKSFNNNILLVRDNGKEKILFKKGIGFSRKTGEIIDKGLIVEKIFVIENEENQKNFGEVLNRVDLKLIAVVEEVIAEIADELDEELNEKIHIALVDHLNFAIERLKNNEEMENPFLVEIETLYNKEFGLALKMANRIKEMMGVCIPEGEIGFIALHIHSARNSGKLSNTIKYSSLSSSVVKHVEEKLKTQIDRTSLDYARFLTHIRFAIERVLKDNKIKNELAGMIKEKYEISYKIAEGAAEIIGKGVEKSISEDEIAYLAMHIERFRICI